jgi:hypothetical protein
MDQNQLLSLNMNVSTLVFVATSMMAMGFSLTITPLCNARLVVLALLADFIRVPTIATLTPHFLPLRMGLETREG